MTDRRIEFLLQFTRLLHASGTPSHNLEEAMSACAESLDIEAQFFSTPTAIFATFGPRAEQRTSLLRVEPHGVDLDRLTRAEELFRDVAERKCISVDEGLRRIAAIEGRPTHRAEFWTTLAFAMSGAGAARFLGGGYAEIGAAGGIGIAIGLLDVCARRIDGLRRLFEPVAAFAATLIAYLFGWFAFTHASELTILATLLPLVPGLTVTVALSELAHGQLASGTARLMGAVVSFLTIGFGVALGRGVTVLLPEIHPTESAPLDDSLSIAVALVAASMAFAILFRAPRRDLPWIIAGGFLGIAGLRAGAFLIGPEIGASVGALTLGFGANLYSRVLRRPNSVVLVPGLILLVPGSLGFRTFAALMEHDVISGVDLAFSMALVAVSLVAGLLVANVALPTRRFRVRAPSPPVDRRHRERGERPE